MSDALAPLRHAYGSDPEGAPAGPGDPGHPEQEALRQLRDVLDAWPAPPPSSLAVAAVEGRAAVVAAAVETTDRALARAFAGRPQPRPTAAAVAAVIARAATPDVIPTASPVEAALVDQSLAMLDRVPAARPAASVIAAIEARAAQASAAQAAALDPMRTALSRAFAARPQPRPSAAAVAAVLARAAEPADAEPLPAASAVEASVLAQSHRALDRLPRRRPSAATLDAVRMAAATAVASSAAQPTTAPVAVPFYQRTSVWGAAAFVMAAVIAVIALPFGGVAPDTTAPLADAVEVAQAVPAPPAPEPAPVAEAPAPPPPAARSASIASAVAAAGITSVAARPQAGRPVSPQSKAAPTPRLAAAVPVETSEWDTADDVRMLSLRLQDLDEADALAWDEAPAEAFGVPASAPASATPGVQVVRDGAPAAPARARLRTDSTSANR